MNEAPTYVLGHSDLEIERLQLQASLIDGITSRLIRECGIAPGMDVLDIGCGAGDVSMLVADAVGPSGKVVAFDREPRAIETARIRAQKRGYRNIEFVVTSDEEWPKHAPFDAAIGRYILPHQADPVANGPACSGFGPARRRRGISRDRIRLSTPVSNSTDCRGVR
jgi:2-polyprenyl-3-methyl-5-hydroxy-6-metoxy-1,4-benzoquinol methylase